MKGTWLRGRRDLRWRFVIAGLVVVLVVMVGLALTLGAAGVERTDVWQSLLHHLGLRPDAPPADGVVWGIRMPRALLAGLVGAFLGIAGVALQGLYRNPLADPHLLAIGPGAAIGAAIGSLGAGTRGAVAGGAAMGVAAALLSRRVARRQSDDAGRLVLVGVALGAVLTAWAGFIVTGSDRTRVPPMEFWLLGNLGSATWVSVQALAVIGGAATIVLFGASRTLDLLALGETEATHLGVDVDLSGSIVSIAVGMMTGAAVGAGGVIGFVGLLIPTLIRPIAPSTHRSLIVAAALAGSAFLIGADTFSRNILVPIEIPVGLVTTAIGGPVFLWLLARLRSVQWS